VELKDTADLIRDFPKAIPKGDLMLAACFFPRHGIRATVGKQNVDFVICFECSMVYIYRGDAKPEVVNIEDGVEPLLNRILSIESDAHARITRGTGDHISRARS
jgi:hypothetical protein